MNLRRIWAVLIACVMALAPVLSLAEAGGAEVPETLYYQGGVVERSSRGIAAYSLDSQLEMGYALANSPYIILGSPTVWEVVISGGTEPYECEALLAWQDLSLDPFANGWAVSDYFYVEDESFTYTFTESARYFWQFNVTDAAGQTLSFQTRIYETYTEADESDVTTVAGKVNSIIASEITPSMSDYSRALALHDWLIYNANYDYTLTHSDAAGVLLYGTGVCDSYARAYLMLATAAGLDCMIVSGTAGDDADSANWGNHAWNLVNLGGSWYHVDCTWDDPNTGGYEQHVYFCVDDETMKKDHHWNTPDDIFDSDGMLVPAAEGGEYEYAEEAQGDYDFTFASWDEYGEKFDQMVANGERRAKTVGLYVGDQAVSDVYAEMEDWAVAKSNELGGKGLITSYGWQYRGNLFTYRLTWVDPTGYIRIDETCLRLSCGETETIVPSEFAPVEDSFIWTSSDSDVATVDYVYDDSTDTITVTITGVEPGAATITATSYDGHSDSIDVTVMSAFTPEFNLTKTEADGDLALSWDLVPGATEYRVMHSCDGVETCLAVVSTGAYTVSEEQLPDNAVNELYIIAVRVVGETDAVSYTSEKLEHVVLSFEAVLPESIVNIDGEAFAGDAALASLYIPDGAMTIGAGAFSSCSSLAVIRIPASVDSISADAFDGSALRFVLTEEGSAAEEWFAQNMEHVVVRYE